MRRVACRRVLVSAILICADSAANAQLVSPRQSLDAATVKCIVDSYPDSVERYGGVAINERAGVLVIVHSGNHVDVWVGCSASASSRYQTTAEAADKLTLSAAGRYLLLSRYMGSSMELFDLREGKSLAHLQDCSAETAMSADERFAIISCSTGVRVLDLHSGTIVAGDALPIGDSVLSMAVNGAFDTLAIGTGGGRIVIASIQFSSRKAALTPKRSWDAYGAGTWVSGLAFAKRNGSLISVSRAGRVDTWDVRAGVARRTVQSDLKWIGSVSFIDRRDAVVLYGTTTPGGFVGTGGEVVDTKNGRKILFGTSSNFIYGAYVHGLDAMLIVGPQGKPVIQNIFQ
jgi:WD40 repeat protein